MLLTYSDIKRTLMHLFLFTISPRENWFQYVPEYTQLQLTFLALQPCGEVAKIQSPWVLLKLCNMRKYSRPISNVWKLMIKFQILKMLAFNKFF